VSLAASHGERTRGLVVPRRRRAVVLSERAERVLQQYYRIDAIRYKAQLAFESEYSIWYTSGLYRDSVKVEKKWLTLLIRTISYRSL
jgi:hypothetical protein